MRKSNVQWYFFFGGVWNLKSDIQSKLTLIPVSNQAVEHMRIATKSNNQNQLICILFENKYTFTKVFTRGVSKESILLCVSCIISYSHLHIHTYEQSLILNYFARKSIRLAFFIAFQCSFVNDDFMRCSIRDAMRTEDNETAVRQKNKLKAYFIFELGLEMAGSMLY